MTLGGRAARRPLRARARLLGCCRSCSSRRGPYLGVAILLLAVVGAANSVEDVAVFTLLQRIVPDEVLTRVLGVVWGLAMGGVALGSIAAPALVDAVGPRTAFVLVGSSCRC